MTDMPWSEERGSIESRSSKFEALAGPDGTIIIASNESSTVYGENGATFIPKIMPEEAES